VPDYRTKKPVSDTANRPEEIYAPYNFAPFSPKVITRYHGEEELPGHDHIDPQLKTGEIHVTFISETPVFVSDGKGMDNMQSPNFCKNADGRFIIPASSVRGLVRENMQILGFGLVRPKEDLQDPQFYFREMAAGKNTVRSALRDHYTAMLGIDPQEKKKAVPHYVMGGHLFCQNGEYYILPTKEPFLRVSREHPDVRQFGEGHARTVEVAYTASDTEVKEICPREKAREDMKKGTLLYTGRPVGRYPNCLYLFPEADDSQSPISISNEEKTNYIEDLEGRKNSLKHYYDVSFWELPKEGKSKPVFYVHREGYTYFGMTRYLRIGYRYPLSHGLPQRHRDLFEQNPNLLDYPSAMMGYARGNKKAYRSRVSFGDFAAPVGVRPMGKVTNAAGEPKASFFPGYVKDGKHYSEEDFELRGYKQYWLKPAKASPPPNANKNVGYSMYPLPEKTKFTGVIRFQNLHEDELGLLLWCLRLEKGCFQTLGKGKPYGYGRMSVKITGLYEYDMKKLYSLQGIYSGKTPIDAAKIDQYINAYVRYASRDLSLPNESTVRNLPEIQDFFYLKQDHSRERKNPEEVAYMKIETSKNVPKPLPTVQAIRDPQEMSPDEEEKYQNNLQALLKKFNPH